MRVRLLDIGGSGVKSAVFEALAPGCVIPTLGPRHHVNPDWRDFATWLDSEGLLDAGVIGIACAGFITTDGTVKLSQVGGWRLKSALCLRMPVSSF